MYIIKPDWITHGDRTQDARNKKPCIYSIHVHPDGKRLATGGLEGHVKIWNTLPIFDEQAEKDPDCHKLLCTMTMHNGAVLCVRWSNGEGRYLASSSDNDNVIIIWERDKNAAAGSVFGSSDVNHESWRAIKYLRGHESDVQDLAWSKDNQYLASSGVDGFVMVWNASTFELVKKIDQHTGFVKGVAWDPSGKFLASQSDDKTVKVWRTSDWGLETDITTPFINAPGTTLFRRLSWSPDGCHIAAANAVNGIQCIAAIINRDDWNADISLVGHQLPIEVTAFNPKMFYMKDDDDTTSKSLSTVCALGSQDRSVSIWVTRFSRPVCVAADIFDHNVYDMAWTPDGKNLFACSHDGTVACLLLAEELQDIAPDEVIYKELTKYGYGRKDSQLPETPIQLELEDNDKTRADKANTSNRITDLMSGNISIETNKSTRDTIMTEITEDSSVPKKDKVSDGDSVMTSSSSTTTSFLLAQQKVTIAKNGKKRIQPMSMSPSSSTTSKTASPVLSQEANFSTHQKRTKTNSQVPFLEYDDPIIIPTTSGIGTTIIGNKRKASSDENMVIGNHSKTRVRPEWIDSAVAPPVLQKSQVKIGLPKVKSILASKPHPNDPTIVMECHNTTTTPSSLSIRAKIVTSRQGVPIWMDYLPSAVLLMVSNPLYSAVSCEDGSIYLYSPSGRRLLPPLIMESTPVILKQQDQWLLVLTATGLLYTWDMNHMKVVLEGISIGPILQAAEKPETEETKAPSIKDVRIQKRNGLPILITSLKQAFIYHLDMKVWMRISDAWYIISKFWGSNGSLEPQAAHPLGWLSSSIMSHSGHDPIAKILIDIARADESTTAVVTLSHIETQLAVAVLLESPKEYIEWMKYYARSLSKEGAKEKVEELCRWLTGPPFISSELTPWEPTILGTISKKDLLNDILPILAQNRQLQRIVTEFKAFLQ
ncbi:WD40-repeat-containing domain protein [Cokeromyces recurvatus]|uniref:WD40-repeat-containing domain protein n=1 Tax=Cokeromyces recurvatus TaxID=90255 RepID=UPI00221EFED8|nr:WD40-repeat-containing domain protein [Cokeromyces recurvatus]KAI7904073.1 WD40-repeat-containing domain protein [Cokeromyces recurvatus]